MIIYSNLMPRRFDGWTIGPVSIIRPSRRDDAGLHAHEAVHRRQFYSTFGLAGIRYLISRRWRRVYEVEAYRAQLEYSPQNIELFARNLSEWYDLGISADIAKRDLTK